MYKNYHTHTYRCKHAKGTVEEYVKAALEKNTAVLGISDHTPLPDCRWPDVRMGLGELEDYNHEIERAREKFPQLLILKGMECEYAEEYLHFYWEVLLEKHGFDYLFAGAHYYPYEGQWYFVYEHKMDKYHLKAYAEYTINAMKSGIFSFMAHPDLFGGAYLVWDDHAIACSRYILEAAESLGMPLEINGYGLRKPKILTEEGERPMYPWFRFWELAAEYDISVVLNSDAHSPQDVIANIDEGVSIAEKYGLKLADLSYLEGRK